MSASNQISGKQCGMTMISWLVTLSIGVFFLLLGIKMVPVYLENFAIRKVLANVEQDHGARRLSRLKLKDNLLRRFSINGVYNFPKENIKFTNTKKGLHIAIDYEVRKPVIGNVSVVMSFSESADIPRND